MPEGTGYRPLAASRRLRQRYPAVFKAIAPLDGVEPLAWLTDVLERMVSGRTKAHELERLLPWAWKAERFATAVDG
jgi:hypothetical protein